MKCKGVLVAFAITASFGFHSLAGAEDGLSKAIRKEVRSKQMQHELHKLRQAAARFDNNPSQEELANFKSRLQKTVKFLEQTGVTLNALGDALEDATGRQEATAKSFALTSPSLAPAQPSPSATAAPAPTRVKGPIVDGGLM